LPVKIKITPLEWWGLGLRDLAVVKDVPFSVLADVRDIMPRPCVWSDVRDESSEFVLSTSSNRLASGPRLGRGWLGGFFVTEQPLASSFLGH